MSIATTFLLRCDRCGFEEAVSDGKERPDGWGSVAARRVGGGTRIGHDGMDDLCATCVAELFAWFAQAPVPAVQPAAPIVTPRAIFTIEDRKQAIKVTTGALATSLEDMRQHLRDDPTSILSEEIPAALLKPLDIHASAIVNGIVRRLNLETPD